MTAVAALHIGGVYAFAHWGLDIDRPVSAVPFQVAVITAEEEVKSEPRPLPLPDFTPPAIQIEQPLIDLPRFDDAPVITVAYKPEPRSTPPVAASALPRLVSSVEYLEPLRPRYPATSRRMREEGTVILLVLVDEKGRASRVEVRDSSGHPRLDKAAEEAVHCARFKPYVEDGRAQPALVLIPVEFSLTTRVAGR